MRIDGGVSTKWPMRGLELIERIAVALEYAAQRLAAIDEWMRILVELNTPEEKGAYLGCDEDLTDVLFGEPCPVCHHGAGLHAMPHDKNPHWECAVCSMIDQELMQ